MNWTDYLLPTLAEGMVSSFNATEKDWTNTSNATAIDGALATTGSNSKERINALMGKFDFSSIPPGSVIDEIEYRLNTPSNIAAPDTQIIWGGGSITEYTGAGFPGANGITLADLLAADFRFGFSEASTSSNRTVTLDALECRVQYTYTPGVPGGFNASAVGFAAHLTWNAVDFADSYTVEKSANGSSWSDLVTVAELEFYDLGLEYSETFYYRVRANNGSTSGAPSATDSVTIDYQGGADTIFMGSTAIKSGSLKMGIANIAAVHYGSTKIWPLAGGDLPTAVVLTSALSGVGVELSWTVSTNALEYRVYRSTTENGAYSLIAENITGLVYVDEPGPGTWWYKVSGLGIYGEGPMSNAESETVVAIDPSVEWVDEQEGTEFTAGQTVTISNVNFGTPSGLRQIVLMIGSRMASSVDTPRFTGITIGGVAATFLGGRGVSPNPSSSRIHDIWSALVPTGTSGDIVLNCGSTGSDGFGFYVLAVDGCKETPKAVEIDTGGTQNPNTHSENVAVDDVIIGSVVPYGQANGIPTPWSLTWTGVANTTGPLNNTDLSQGKISLGWELVTVAGTPRNFSVEYNGSHAGSEPLVNWLIFEKY